MDELESLIIDEDWDAAASLASSLSLPASYVAQHKLTALINNQTSLTPLQLTSLLGATIPDDALWSAQAALQLALTGTSLELTSSAVNQGLEATLAAAATSPALQLVIDPKSAQPAPLASPLLDNGPYAPPPPRAAGSLSDLDEDERTIVLVRHELLQLQDRLAAWRAAFGESEPANGVKVAATSADAVDDDEANWDLGDDAPEADQPESEAVLGQPKLVEWLTSDLTQLAFELATAANTAALVALCGAFSEELYPARLELLDALPEWVEPESYLPLLPSIGADGEEAQWVFEGAEERRAEDWADKLVAAEADLEDNQSPATATAQPSPSATLSATEIAEHYTRRIESVAALGLISEALELAQHLASRGLPGLDALGEELSLLSRLVYDRPQPTSTSSHQEEPALTLAHWRSLEPAAVVRAYVAHSSAASLADDLRQLVLPYLSVLESHLERAGTPDSSLPNRMLADFILSLAGEDDLERLAAVFEASTPALPSVKRLVRDDAELARLALAASYGCPAKGGDSLPALGRVFECLPALGGSAAVGGGEERKSIYSLWTSTTSPTPTASSLHSALQSFPPQALATALDALDLHLSTAEIFARYSCPVPLGWMLESHYDPKSQRFWAQRMARTAAGGGVGGQGEGGEFEGEDEWVLLMEEMLAWTDAGEGGEEGEQGKVFWKLERDEVARIFFGGLLAAGKFGLAKSLLQPSSGASAPPLSPSAIEELVISASRELYDNADSGNLHSGDMKLAFDCLSAAPQTVSIRRERDFIEATSRLTSFRLQSQPGVPLSPIEIRLAPDRMALVGKLLGANEDAYRHPEVIMELVAKLGYGAGGLAGVRAQAMIADAALQAQDATRAQETLETVVEQVKTLTKTRETTEEDKVKAREVAWQACFNLGRSPAVNREGRMRALGLGMTLCPAEQIALLLNEWTTLDASEATKTEFNTLSRSTAPGLTDVAGAAGRQLGRAAAYLPFGMGNQGHPEAMSRSQGQTQARMDSPQRREGSSGSVRDEQHGPSAQQQHGGQGGQHGFGRDEGLRAGLSKGLTAGVGWLIGANPDDL